MKYPIVKYYLCIKPGWYNPMRVIQVVTLPTRTLEFTHRVLGVDITAWFGISYLNNLKEITAFFMRNPDHDTYEESIPYIKIRDDKQTSITIAEALMLHEIWSENATRDKLSF